MRRTNTFSKKTLALLLTIAMMPALWPMSTAEAEAYGPNGKFIAQVSVPDPKAIKIYTAEDLYNIRNKSSQAYVLMNDIDLAGFKGGQWTPIGDAGTFYGLLDGQGHVIKNLTITGKSTRFCGLFGAINGRVTNLGLENVYIDITADEEQSGPGSIRVTSKTQEDINVG